ncbi:MAG: M10 family metallopeptidase [Cyanobacteria bacterium P01_B01_bin.77]
MAYGFGTSTTNNTSTGNNNIDSLIANRRWRSRNVTYSFTSNFRNDYEDESGYPNSGVHNSTFSRLNATQRSATRDWMAMYESVSGLNMIELSGTSDRHATLRMAESSHPRTTYAYLPGGSVQAGDIFFNRTSYNSPRMGNYAFHTFGHEIGHALGLEHGHEANGVRNVAMNSNRDSMEFSIMTYRSYEGDPLSGGYSNERWGYAQSLMMYDIRAIQQMYGVNFNHNSGNTTYTFSTTTGEMFVNGVGQGQPGGNNIFRTIWDGNGVDTYNFSNYSNNLNINLAPGRWTDLDMGGNDQRAYLGDGKYARGHVFNALQYNGDTRSLIENAYGGSGNDRIYGNRANNYLRGNGGNDRIYGYAGNDTIVGGTGNDSLYGGDGRDYIWGGSGNDFISGGRGDDFMDGGSGIDTVDYRHWNGGGTYNLNTGIASFSGYYNEEIRNFENIYTGNGADVVVGTNGANRIYTNGGNDFISALGGNDYVSAGAGADTVYGGSGNDVINGNNGNDYLLGGRGNDNIVGGLGNDRVNGTTHAAQGTGERDILRSGNMNDRDTFILGENGRVFYNDRGNTDHAVIRDFDVYNFVGDVADRIQLLGSSASYSLGNVSVNGVAGAGIHFAGDLIGIVQNISASSLNLSNTNQFTYV